MSTTSSPSGACCPDLLSRDCIRSGRTKKTRVFKGTMVTLLTALLERPLMHLLRLSRWSVTLCFQRYVFISLSIIWRPLGWDVYISIAGSLRDILAGKGSTGPFIEVIPRVCLNLVHFGCTWDKMTDERYEWNAGIAPRVYVHMTLGKPATWNLMIQCKTVKQSNADITTSRPNGIPCTQNGV